MGRPREHDESAGEALLDQAELLLSSGGPEAVSVRNVAQAAGTTTRAVYTVFGSKDGLIEALAIRGYRTLSELVNAKEPTDAPASDLVRAGIDGFRAFAISTPHLFRVTFERVPTHVVASPTALRAAGESYDALVRWIRRAQGAGVIDDRPEAEIAFSFHALCQGLAGGELSREPPPVGTNFWGPVHGIPGERLWRRALEALVAGLAPCPATAPGPPDAR
jgi:AcrR family transcriptional regulator